MTSRPVIAFTPLLSFVDHMSHKEFDLTESDVSKIIMANSHLGQRQADKALQPYIYSRAKDGTYIFNVRKMYKKIQLAARFLVTLDPQDIVIVGQREEAHRGINKFAKHIRGVQAVTGRFMPGSLTNKQSPTFREPKAIIVADPELDHQALLESSYANVATIAFVNSASKLNYVDIAIPCNNKGKRSIGLMLWMLCREYLRVRGRISYTDEWELPDTFIQITEQEMHEQQQQEEQQRLTQDEQAEYHEEHHKASHPKQRKEKQSKRKEDSEDDPFYD